MARKLNKRMPGQARAHGPAAGSLAMASSGYGNGGPAWLDDFRTKRAPTLPELVESYKSLAYACMMLNAQAGARVPLRLYCKTGPRDRAPRRHVRSLDAPRERYIRGLRSVQQILNGDCEVKEVADHPFLEALDSPNPHFDGNAFLVYAFLCLDAVGSFYFLPDRPDPSWAASQWWPLPAQHVQPIRGAGSMVLTGYSFFGGRLEVDEVERVRTVSLKDPYLSAFAPLHACFEQLKLSNKYTAVVETILGNDAQIGLVGSPSDPKLVPQDAERKRYQDQLNANLTGAGRARILLTNGAYNFTRMQASPADLGGLEITKSMRLTVANCFGVPISLLQAEDSNRAVAEAGNYQHQRNAVEPRCVMLASGLTRMARKVDPRLFFCFDNPVEADKEQRAKIFDMEVKAGRRTINEWRAEEGAEPVEWGDRPWFLETMVQALPPPKGEDAGGATPGQADTVQDSAMNGAQVASLVDLVAQVVAGQLPPESAKAMISAAYPALTADQVAAIMGPADGFEPKAMPAPAAPPGAKPGKGPGVPVGESEPDEDEAPAPAAKRSLEARLERILTTIEADYEDDRPGHGNRDPGAVLQATPAGPGRRAAEHVWAADGGADPERAGEVVPPAAPADPGDDTDPGDGAPPRVPPADGLRRPDSVGHDADPGGLLAGSGPGSEGAPGPGHGGMEGDQPAPGGADQETGV